MDRCRFVLVATQWADHSLIMVGHLPQKSGESFATIVAENIHFLFRLVHSGSISPAMGRRERAFLWTEILHLPARFAVPDPMPNA
jgi:hypothetical protein